MLADQERRAREYRLREAEEADELYRQRQAAKRAAEDGARRARIAERERVEAAKRAEARKLAEAVATVAAAVKRVPASSPARRAPATDADFKRWANAGRKGVEVGRVERRAFDEHGQLMRGPEVENRG